MNATEFILDKGNVSFFNTGCIEEVNKALSMCEDFKAQVLTTVTHRFEYAIIILCVLIFISTILKYSGWKFYDRIEFHIDWVIIAITICVIALMFV